VKVVVGLGNPGREYERTRHNVGFMVVERLAETFDGTFRRSRRADARCAAVDLGGAGRMLLVEPLTFMNASGEAVGALMRWHRASPTDLVVVYDDVDLPAGALRLRPKGGAGGHKGVQSVIEALGTDGFARIRIGIGRAPGFRDTVDHVLSAFAREEQPAMDEAVKRAAAAVESVVREGVERAMNEFNRDTNAGGQP
jgi:PTH1 family peptidyl-tRNA hydrolase